MLKSRIGLALSGGGIRASIFHLGVLQYLAEGSYFSNIASISSVSGASLAMGVIFAANGNRWPTADEYVGHVQPKVRQIILHNNLQQTALRRLPFYPNYWLNKVRLLAQVLEDKWGISGNLQDLPLFPHWEINCTTFETGKYFRFRKDYMGDPDIGYVQQPKLPISHMIAASAAFPVLIGPYILETDGMSFTPDKHGMKPEKTVNSKYTLWDGGVYDNLGLEALYKTGRGLDHEIDFLIVSNAGADITHQLRKRNFSVANLKRLLDISGNQVDCLRSEQVNAAIISKHRGLYLKMEMDYPTTLNSPSAGDFDRIFQHGYEVASANAAYLEAKPWDSVPNPANF